MTRALRSARPRPRTRRTLSMPGSHALAYPLAYRRRRARAFFLAQTAQQVETISAGREVARAALALGGLVAWAGLVLLLGG